MKEETKYIAFRLDKDLYDELKKEADTNLSTISRLLRLAVLNYLKKPN